MTSWDGLNRPRVFWPGDELPVGVTVMGRDGSVGTVKYLGMKVRDYRDYAQDPYTERDSPLVEVVLPDWEKAVRAAGPRRVDPPGCGCADCVLGMWSKPLDQVSYESLRLLIGGQLQNATGLELDGLEDERELRWNSFRRLLDGDT